MDGRVLDDRYELGEVIGRGGSGVVHRAWDRLRRRAVAVKLTASVLDDRARAEADILEGLDHPNLVALHDVLLLRDGTALVMELVDGPSLQSRLRQGAVTTAEAAVILRDVAAALAHAHRRGVVHRDLKPGNVLLRLEDGVVTAAVLSDFGIARLADATRTTREGLVVGTVRYLSPEQARGERAIAASDVYSLGLTVLTALSGAEAFPGGEAESLAGRLLRPPPLPDGLPLDWVELLGGMTELEPAHRFDASATAALAAVLGSARREVGSPPDASPVVGAASPAPVRGRLTRAAVAVALVGAAAGAVVAVMAAPVDRQAVDDRPGIAATRAPVAPSARPRPAAVGSAPSVPSVPEAAAPAARTDVSGSATTAGRVPASSGRGDHSGRGDDSSGRGSGRRGSGSGSSGHGSGHAED